MAIFANVYHSLATPHTHTHTRCACVSFIRGLPCIGISLCVLLTHIPRVCMSTFPKAGLKGWKSFSPCGPCLHGQQRSTTSKSCHCRLEKRKTTKNPTQRSIARHRWAGHGAFFCSCRVGGGGDLHANWILQCSTSKNGSRDLG